LEWKKAIDEEMQSHNYNGTWKLIERPKNATLIKTKWVFKRKRDVNGKLLRHKARLVAKGFTQIKGEDYDETFAPVVRPTSVRILLSIAAILDYGILQVDIKTAFLNGELNEDIYIEQPEGSIHEGNKNMVCKLNKALYGLKQASRCWNQTFHEFMIMNDLRQNASDDCAYVNDNNSKWCAILIYVDDIIIVGRTRQDAMWGK
jgi:hypothetical protein